MNLPLILQENSLTSYLTSFLQLREDRAHLTSNQLLQPQDLTYFGTPSSQVIVWEGLQELLLILINLYYLNKYDTCD